MGECVFSGYLRRALQSVLQGPETGQKIMAENGVFRRPSSELVECYAKNDRLGLVIPYEFQGVSFGYEPDYLVRLSNKMTLVLEIKGYEDNKTKAKHQAAKKWVNAVNNWQELGKWAFHVCRNPQKLDSELKGITPSGK